MPHTPVSAPDVDLLAVILELADPDRDAPGEGLRLLEHVDALLELRLVGQGLTNREIGRSLGLREATVRKHLENVFARLGVLSRTAAVTSVFGFDQRRAQQA